jgi:Fe-S cluster assembly protein SufD
MSEQELTTQTLLARLAATTTAAAPAGVPTRADAASRAATLALPARSQEAWRFVKLGGLLGADFAPLTAAELAAVPAPVGVVGVDAVAARLVFVQGAYAPALSSVPAIAGVTITTFAASGAPSGAGDVALAAFGEDTLAALNAATLADGVSIVIGRNVSVALPIHVIHVAAGGAAGAGYAPSLLSVRVGRGSKAALVEEHVGHGAAWSNAVTEIVVEDSARLDHIKVQDVPTGAWHTARCAVKVEAHGAYDSTTAQLGGALARQDTVARLVGGGATCALHGLTLVGGEQQSDTHTVVEHAHAHTTSDQLHKCVVSDGAHAVFNGKIHVLQDAQQIAAYQLNRNLLLSNKAKVDTKPQLEIFADDVKCTHGATIGQLDLDQLFYLQTRGLGVAEARELLTYAFAAQVLDKITVEPVRAALVAELGRRAGR